MSWTIVVSVAKKSHQCRPPNLPDFLAQHEAGTVLRCDECGQHWRRNAFPASAFEAWARTEAPVNAV